MLRFGETPIKVCAYSDKSACRPSLVRTRIPSLDPDIPEYYAGCLQPEVYRAPATNADILKDCFIYLGWEYFVLNLLVRLTGVLLLACGAAAAEPEPDAVNFVQIGSIEELDRSLSNLGGKPALLRIRADWSIGALEMEKHFASKTLQSLLMEVVLLETDVTEDTEAHRELLSYYGIFGPPQILFFDRYGARIPGTDIVGYETAIELEKRIRDALMIDASTSMEEQ